MILGIGDAFTSRPVCFLLPTWKLTEACIIASTTLLLHRCFISTTDHRITDKLLSSCMKDFLSFSVKERKDAVREKRIEIIYEVQVEKSDATVRVLISSLFSHDATVR